LGYAVERLVAKPRVGVAPTVARESRRLKRALCRKTKKREPHLEASTPPESRPPAAGDQGSNVADRVNLRGSGIAIWFGSGRSGSLARRPTGEGLGEHH
jgi:hypothetical protein